MDCRYEQEAYTDQQGQTIYESFEEDSTEKGIKPFIANMIEQVEQEEATSND